MLPRQSRGSPDGTSKFSVHFEWLAAGVAAASLAFPAGALAGTIIVPDGESIQQAVEAANPGDTIIVKSGIYNGTSGDSAGNRAYKMRSCSRASYAGQALVNRTFTATSE